MKRNRLATILVHYLSELKRLLTKRTMPNWCQCVCICVCSVYPCFCSGVNMYAMLTGSLPFTVEPFNITELHAKMISNRMNPIPNQISDGKSTARLS